MPKIIFKFDKEKDLYNIWETCNSSSTWFNHKKFVSPILLEICEEKKLDECKEELLQFRDKMYNSGFIIPFINAVQESWNKINDEFFKRLEKITDNKFPFEEVNAYITTVTRCPYDYKESWFMISFFKDILSALVTCGHELMHIHFHNLYWDKIEKQIGQEKTADLKEALTVLLNIEFRDLWFVDDRGYEPHKELRKFIEEEWKKDKNFDVLMERCINYLQKNDP
jgi:hypothetical protein